MNSWLNRSAVLLRRGTTVALAAVPIGSLAYAAVLVIHQTFYGALGVSVDDVGLGRDTLLGQPLLAMIALSGLFLALIGPATVLLLVVILGRRVSRRIRRRRSEGPDVAQTQKQANQSTTAGVISRLISDASRSADERARSDAEWATQGSRPPRRNRSAQVLALLFGTAFALLAGSVVYSYVLARNLARDVRDGDPVDQGRIVGLALLDVSASRFVFAREPEQGDGHIAPRDAECMLYLGRTAETLTLFDVRSGRPVRLPAEEYAIVARSERLPVPGRCRQTAEPSGNTLDAAAPGLGDVSASPSVIAWTQRTRAGRLRLVVFSRQRRRIEYAAVPPSVRPMTPDVGTNKKGRVIVTFRLCGHRCSLGAYDVRLQRWHRLAIPTVPGCTTAWPSASGDLVVFLRRGVRCPTRMRGLWAQQGGNLRRVRADVGPAAGQLDALDEHVAWIDGDGLWTALRLTNLRTRRTFSVLGPFPTEVPGTPSDSTLLSSALSGDKPSPGFRVTISSPWLSRRKSQERLWWATWIASKEVTGAIVALTRNTKRCSVMSNALPTNDRAVNGLAYVDSGIDAAATADTIVYASAGTLRERTLANNGTESPPVSPLERRLVDLCRSWR